MAVPLRDAAASSPSDNGRSEISVVLHRLIRLLQLELELGLTETKGLAKTLGLAIGIAVVGLIVILASLVVLVAGAIAPVFGAEWRHLIISGGVFFVLAAAGVGWSLSKFRKVPWPEETMRSLEETKQWLGAQLRSKLT